MITVKCQLVASENDFAGYCTLVFKVLENNCPFGHSYVMVTRLPNWDHRPIELNEKGYLTYNEVEAGKDSWYCSETGQFIPYNYTNLYFIKFVKEQDNSIKDIII